MKLSFFFKNMAKSDEQKLQEYFSGKLPAIEKIVGRFPSDTTSLHVTGEKFNKHSAYKVEFTLSFPGRTIKAAEDSHMITKAVDFAKDRLLMQLKKDVLQTRRTHRSIKAKNKLRLRVSQTA